VAEAEAEAAGCKERAGKEVERNADGPPCMYVCMHVM